eukprot:6152382-Amphidinium_carterae.1
MIACVPLPHVPTVSRTHYYLSLPVFEELSHQCGLHALPVGCQDELGQGLALFEELQPLSLLVGMPTSWPVAITSLTRRATSLGGP